MIGQILIGVVVSLAAAAIFDALPKTAVVLARIAGSLTPRRFRDTVDFGAEVIAAVKSIRDGEETKVSVFRSAIRILFVGVPKLWWQAAWEARDSHQVRRQAAGVLRGVTGDRPEHVAARRSDQGNSGDTEETVQKYISAIVEATTHVVVLSGPHHGSAGGPVQAYDRLDPITTTSHITPRVFWGSESPEAAYICRACNSGAPEHACGETAGCDCCDTTLAHEEGLAEVNGGVYDDDIEEVRHLYDSGDPQWRLDDDGQE